MGQRTHSLAQPVASRAHRTWVVSLVLVALSCAALSGCASDPLAEQYREGSGKNFIAGDGTIAEIAPENRGEPIVFRGEDESGQTVDSSELRGNVVVVNFWYAGCAPCRAEAPLLEEAFQKTATSGTAFVGVNVRDQSETALTFNEQFGVTYPSIIDTNGQTQLAFASNVPPNAVPTTLVLDRQGRVAARILGQLSATSILMSIIDTVAGEKT